MPPPRIGYHLFLLLCENSKRDIIIKINIRLYHRRLILLRLLWSLLALLWSLLSLLLRLRWPLLALLA